MANLLAKNFNEEEKERTFGLKDGGHVVLKCSKCDKPVFSLWIVKPNFNFEANYKATCPYCNGFSYTKKIKGQITTGGIPENGDYYSDESKVLTFMDGFDTIEEDGETVILFKIGKNK